MTISAQSGISDKYMLIRVAIYIAIGVILIVGYIKYLETKGIYFPEKDIELTPQFLNLAYEDIYTQAKDGVKINGWFIPHKDAEYTILFCHGNAGNISHRIEKIGLLHNLGLNIFIIDYRGYGRSQGIVSEKGMYNDAQAAYDYLVSKLNIQAQKIILYGESLGGAVVINLASSVEVGGLILEGSFSRGRDMARKYYPYLPVFFFANTFDSLTKIQKVNSPILFIHSKDDEIVPIALARKLYDAISGQKQFTEITGDHNNAFLESQDKYTSSIASFIKNLR